MFHDRFNAILSCGLSRVALAGSDGLRISCLLIEHELTILGLFALVTFIVRGIRLH